MGKTGAFLARSISTNRYDCWNSTRVKKRPFRSYIITRKGAKRFLLLQLINDKPWVISNHPKLTCVIFFLNQSSSGGRRLPCVASVSVGFSAFSEVWLRGKWGESKTKKGRMKLLPTNPTILQNGVHSRERGNLMVRRRFIGSCPNRVWEKYNFPATGSLEECWLCVGDL